MTILNEYQMRKIGELRAMIYLIQECRQIIKNYDGSTPDPTYIETEDALILVTSGADPRKLSATEIEKLKSEATHRHKKVAQHGTVRLRQSGDIERENGEGRSYKPIDFKNV